jgi:hypothetical protein
MLAGRPAMMPEIVVAGRNVEMPDQHPEKIARRASGEKLFGKSPMLRDV